MRGKELKGHRRDGGVRLGRLQNCESVRRGGNEDADNGGFGCRNLEVEDREAGIGGKRKMVASCGPTANKASAPNKDSTSTTFPGNCRRKRR